jgi:hypothetical protein
MNQDILIAWAKGITPDVAPKSEPSRSNGDNVLMALAALIIGGGFIIYILLGDIK